jgi:hypothetical protein
MGVRTAEPHKILSWQVELMVGAGIRPDIAIQMAESGVSWHDVADLIDRGCPTYLVPVILAQP